MNKTQIGRKNEKKAAEYLKNLGFEILKTNYSTRYGEIDIIAKQDNTVVFVEVRSRKNLSYGYPEESINEAKINRIKKTAELFLLDFQEPFEDVRFDLISIINQSIRHIQNAF